MPSAPHETCPLCRWSIAGSEAGIHGIRVACRLCGRFTISKNAIASLKPADGKLIPYLSCHIRQANNRGEEFNVASHSRREYAMSHKETTFSRIREKRMVEGQVLFFDFGGRIKRYIGSTDGVNVWFPSLAAHQVRWWRGWAGLLIRHLDLQAYAWIMTSGV
jgi:hypothetical protein